MSDHNSKNNPSSWMTGLFMSFFANNRWSKGVNKIEMDFAWTSYSIISIIDHLSFKTQNLHHF